MPRLVVLLVLLLVAGCAQEDDGSAGLTGTFLRMRDAGFDWTSVEHRQPERDVHEIRVELRTSEPDQQAAERAAKLVWTTHEGPLDVVSVVVNDDYLWKLDRGGLRSRFGQRTESSPPDDDASVLLWSVLLGLVGVFAVARLAVKLRRRS